MHDRVITATVFMAVAGLMPSPCQASQHQSSTPEQRQETSPPTITILVKVLVDNEEPATQKRWEERLRKRLTAASDTLTQTCGVRFEVVATGKWDADPKSRDFRESLREFEREVNPAPGQLAIGFTSKLREGDGCQLVGITSGAFHSHILVREWDGVTTEPERLEVLVHELGHHLGAVHSSAADSVMRPRLGDGKARRRKFQIAFDPLNAQAMRLVAASVRRADSRTILLLDAQTKQELEDVYAELARSLPADPLAGEYLKLLRNATKTVATPEKAAAKPARSSPLIEATRQVLAAVVQTAEQNPQPDKSSAARAAGTGGRSADRLTESYFREAAIAAGTLPREQAASAYLLALAVAIDRSSMLRNNFLTRELWVSIESDVERSHRLKLLGTPTMWNRHDLAQHFVVSAALTVLYGPKAARDIGLCKELQDARGGSGFSFADFAADLSGIAFANYLKSSHGPLDDLLGSFVIQDFLPEPTGLRERIAWDEFVDAFGSVTDEGFRAEEAKIQERIQSLPRYKTLTDR